MSTKESELGIDRVDFLKSSNLRLSEILDQLANLFRDNASALGELDKAKEKRARVNRVADFTDFVDYLMHLGHFAEALTLQKCRCTSFDLKLRRMKIVAPQGIFSTLALRKDFLERLAADFTQLSGSFRVMISMEDQNE